MDLQKLEAKVRKSRAEGFKDEEIQRIMMQEGYSKNTVKQVFEDLDKGKRRNQRIPRSQQSQQRDQVREQNRRIQQSSSDPIKGIELDDNEYKIRQHLILNKYKIWDSDNELAMRAKKKMFRLYEHFKFYDSDHEKVFDVKAKKILDIAGDYKLIDSETEEAVTILEKNWTFFTQKWKIKDASSDEKLLARFQTENKGRAAIRFIGGKLGIIPFVDFFFGLIPHLYIIESAEGNKIGEMKGKISIRDTYKLDIDPDLPRDLKESIVASAIAIDALEGN